MITLLPRDKKEELASSAHLRIDPTSMSEDELGLAIIKLLRPKQYDEARGFDTNASLQAVADFREHLLWQLYDAYVINGAQPKRAPSTNQFAQDATASSISRTSAKESEIMSKIPQARLDAIAAHYRVDTSLPARTFKQNVAKAHLAHVPHLIRDEDMNDDLYLDAMLANVDAKLEERMRLDAVIAGGTRSAPSVSARTDSAPVDSANTVALRHQWKLDSRGERGGVSFDDYAARHAIRLASVTAHQTQRHVLALNKPLVGKSEYDTARLNAMRRSQNAHKGGNKQ